MRPEAPTATGLTLRTLPKITADGLRCCHPIRMMPTSLRTVGQEIYDLRAPKPPQLVEFERIIADQYYSPEQVGFILSASRRTGERHIVRSRKSIDIAKPRAKKRCLRIKGSDLRAYLNGLAR